MVACETVWVWSLRTSQPVFHLQVPCWPYSTNIAHIYRLTGAHAAGNSYWTLKVVANYDRVLCATAFDSDIGYRDSFLTVSVGSPCTACFKRASCILLSALERPKQYVSVKYYPNERYHTALEGALSNVCCVPVCQHAPSLLIMPGQVPSIRLRYSTTSSVWSSECINGDKSLQSMASTTEEHTLSTWNIYIYTRWRSYSPWRLRLQDQMGTLSHKRTVVLGQ